MACRSRPCLLMSRDISHPFHLFHPPPMYLLFQESSHHPYYSNPTPSIPDSIVGRFQFFIVQTTASQSLLANCTQVNNKLNGWLQAFLTTFTNCKLLKNFLFSAVTFILLDLQTCILQLPDLSMSKSNVCC